MSYLVFELTTDRYVDSGISVSGAVGRVDGISTSAFALANVATVRAKTELRPKKRLFRPDAVVTL